MEEKMPQQPVPSFIPGEDPQLDSQLTVQIQAPPSRIRKQYPQMQKDLAQFNDLVKKILNIYQQRIAVNLEDVDSVALEFANSLLMLQNLINDVFKLIHLETDQQAYSGFLKDHSYLKGYASSLYSRPINEEWFMKSLKMFIDTMKLLSTIKPQDKPNVYIMFQKVKAINTVYQYAITFDKEDLFSLEKTHQKWDEVRRFTKNKVLATPALMLKDISNLHLRLQTATAITQKSTEMDSEFSKALALAFGGLVYTFGKEKRERRNTNFRSTLDIKKVKMLWNMSEAGLAKFFVKATFPYISYMKKIYIEDSQYPKLTKNSVLKWVNSKAKKLELESQQSTRSDVSNVKPTTNNTLFVPDPNKICVRVMCDKNLERDAPYKVDGENDHATIIYHIHGGGFIALSSRTHQSYTRRWAKKCNTPVFSVDYKKAPENPYPEGLNDVWQTYNWLLNESHNHFKIRKNKRIVVAGDSAGGNLAFALTNLCIENNVQVPHSIASFYPAVNISLKSFTPSLLHCLQDPLLSFGLVTACTNSYIQEPEFDALSDYYISPLWTPDEILKKYPLTRMFIGEKDPLHDDAVKMALRLWKNKVNVTCTVYENMIHGYLNFDVPGGLKYAQPCVEDSIETLKEMVSSWSS